MAETGRAMGFIGADLRAKFRRKNANGRGFPGHLRVLQTFRLAEQFLEEHEGVLRLAPLDPHQDLLIGLVGRGLALWVDWRGDICDAALVTVQDRVDAGVEAVDVVAHLQLAGIVDEGSLAAPSEFLQFEGFLVPAERRVAGGAHG
jgi:hypothetical protein